MTMTVYVRKGRGGESRRNGIDYEAREGESSCTDRGSERGAGEAFWKRDYR